MPGLGHWTCDWFFLNNSTINSFVLAVRPSNDSMTRMNTPKFFTVLIVMFSSLSAMSAEPMKIFGGPGALKELSPHKGAIEKAIGRPVEMREQAGDVAIIALTKGHIDAVATSPNLAGIFQHDGLKKAGITDTSVFEEKIYGATHVYIAVHPDNPVSGLSKEQITDLLSGKLKTWESLNGKKDPVRVVLNKTQVSTIKLVPKFYLDKTEIPNVIWVTTVDGAMKNLQQNPGTITFTGTKFETSDFKPKFFETEVKFTYSFIAKKPLSPEMTKIFSLLKTP